MPEQLALDIHPEAAFTTEGPPWTELEWPSGRTYRWRLTDEPTCRGEWWDDHAGVWIPPRSLEVEFRDERGQWRELRFYTRKIQIWNELRYHECGGCQGDHEAVERRTNRRTTPNPRG